MPKIVRKAVISLEGSPRKERFFAQEFAKDFTVWPAFDGRTGAGRDIFDVEKFKELYGREPRGGEIGCTISHYQLLKDFANEPGNDDDLLLVSEDDAVFSPHLSKVLRNICRLKSVSFVHLGHAAEDFRRTHIWESSYNHLHLSLLAKWVGPFPLPSRHRVGEYFGELWGTGLYLVSRSTAKHLVEYADAQSLHWVADDFQDWHSKAGATILLTRPTLAGWDGESEIGNTVHLEFEVHQGSAWGRAALKKRYHLLRIAFGLTRRSAKQRLKQRYLEMRNARKS